ncbi:unnamed protein product, partial [Didymodactylos carnosus]
VLDLCPNAWSDFISIYEKFLSESKMLENCSYFICELAMFHANHGKNMLEACQILKYYLAESSIFRTIIEPDHRLYLSLVLLYTYAFGSFPHQFYTQFDINRFSQQTTGKCFTPEPFLCPWYIVDIQFSTNQDNIDQLFSELSKQLDMCQSFFPFYINQVQWLNITHRFKESQCLIENLLETNPLSSELWIELIDIFTQNISSSSFENLYQILERANETTGIRYEFIYCLARLLIMQ